MRRGDRRERVAWNGEYTHDGVPSSLGDQLGKMLSSHVKGEKLIEPVHGLEQMGRTPH